MTQGRRPGRGWTSEGKVLMLEVGIWLLVCTCVCQGAPHPEEGGGSGLGTVTCLNNNILRIDCHWSAPALIQGDDAWLLLISHHAPGSKHRCVFRAGTCSVELPPQEVLVPSDSFTIMLHRHFAGQEQVSLVDPQYLPRRHVKLDPPLDLRSNVSSDYCTLTWSVSPALEPMTWLLAYELAFKREVEDWEHARHKDHIVGVTQLALEAVELDPGSAYEARLRVQMAPEDDAAEEERYEGPWRSPSPPWGRPDSAVAAASIFLLMSSLTYLLFKLSPRVKRAFHQDVPSPAAFFQPLYAVHHGNFQTWTGTHRVGLQVTQPGVPASSLEVVAPLTCSPVWPWPPPCLLEGGLVAQDSEDVLTAGGRDWEEQPPAYLPQEDWVPGLHIPPGPPDSEGSSSDYCALGYYEGCHTLSPPGHSQTPVLIPALACGLSLDQRDLNTQGFPYGC